MSNCINQNCQVCKNLVFTDAVTVVTVGGVDTLVLDIPASGCYCNGRKVCLVITQTIPDTATINMPVAISIGGDTTTVYPILRCDCTQATACQFRTRKKYALRIFTTATSAVFKSLGGLSCCPTYALDAIPVTTVAAGASVLSLRSVEPVASTATTTKTTKTTKEVQA